MDRPPAYPKHTVIVRHSQLSWRSYGFSEFKVRKVTVNTDLIFLIYSFQFPYVSILPTLTYGVSLCTKCQRPDSLLEWLYDSFCVRFRRVISVFEMKCKMQWRMTVVRIWEATPLFFWPSLSDPSHVPYTTENITELLEFNCTGIYSSLRILIVHNSTSIVTARIDF